MCLCSSFQNMMMKLEKTDILSLLSWVGDVFFRLYVNLQFNIELRCKYTKVGPS